ncbi:hypothetical protein RJ640_003335 [Escallonia rubra]|uniref:ABC1 atypical kinase-like domain-containing protein n=1 Tax=Escallonia rubra TaxID=112253 RepID=A0AA88UEC3_9ASTE|nr:hypothetical protein RJ640_003335 [Escallonia rubra]
MQRCLRTGAAATYCADDAGYDLDQDPSFPSETVVSIVEEELGAPVNDIFDWFDFEPIAAASLVMMVEEEREATPNGWSTVADHQGHCSIIFPPINHECLHLSNSSTNPERHNPLISDSAPPLRDHSGVAPPLPLWNPQLRPAVACAARCWRLGLQLLRFKVAGIASSARNFASSGGELIRNLAYVKGAVGSSRCPARAAVVAAGVMLALLWLGFRRRRRLLARKEDASDLISLIKEKDEIRMWKVGLVIYGIEEL